MVKVQFAITDSLEYPECKYAKQGDKQIECTHPKRGMYAFCASYHSLDTCPFDIREELRQEGKEEQG